MREQLNNSEEPKKSLKDKSGDESIPLFPAKQAYSLRPIAYKQHDEMWLLFIFIPKPDNLALELFCI